MLFAVAAWATVSGQQGLSAEASCNSVILPSAASMRRRSCATSRWSKSGRLSWVVMLLVLMAFGFSGEGGKCDLDRSPLGGNARDVVVLDADAGYAAAF